MAGEPFEPMNERVIVIGQRQMPVHGLAVCFPEMDWEQINSCRSRVNYGERVVSKESAKRI